MSRASSSDRRPAALPPAPRATARVRAASSATGHPASWPSCLAPRLAAASLTLVAGAGLGALGGGATAEGAGFYISDIGTRGMGRAGAFVAAPDSVLAMHYNPAGLALLRGLHAEASLSLVQLDLEFQRACPCAASELAGATDVDAALAASFQPANSTTPIAIPFLGAAYGLPFLNLTVAVAAWGPNSGRHDWETPAAQRYSAVYVKNLEANFALGAGFEPLEGLRFGAAIMGYQSAADQTLSLWANSATFASTAEDSRFDVPLTFRFHRDLAITWTAGVSWEPMPGLNIGASFRPKREILSEGTVDVIVPKLLADAGATVTGNAIDVELQTAPILRGGVEYSIPRLFRAEAAVVAELWSVHNRILIRPKDIIFTLGSQSQPLPEILIDRGWRDTFSVRLGGELNVLEPDLGLRAGYFFEPSAIPVDRVDPSRVDLDKHGFALGASTQLMGATLEVSAMYVALASTEITGSAVRQKAPLNPPLGSPELVTTIGNGRYDGRYFIGSVSLSFALDTMLAAIE